MSSSDIINRRASTLDLVLITSTPFLSLFLPPSFAASHTPSQSSVSPRTEGDRAALEHSLEYIQSQRYDVFLSFAKEDVEFAEEVRQKLKLKAQLEVFVPSEGQQRLADLSLASQPPSLPPARPRPPPPPAPAFCGGGGGGGGGRGGGGVGGGVGSLL